MNKNKSRSQGYIYDPGHYSGNAAPAFRLPKQKSPLIVFILLCGLSIFATTQFYRPEPVVIAPAMAAPIAPPPPLPDKHVTVPELSELEELARLMPDAAAKPLPVAKAPVKSGQASPKIKVSLAPLPRDKIAELNKRAIKLARQNHPEAALELLLQAQLENPDHAATLHNIAVLNDRMGDSDSAAKYYKAALLAPDATGIRKAAIKSRLQQLSLELKD